MSEITDPAHQYLPPGQETLYRRLQAADKPGYHLWVMVASWIVPDPRAARDGLSLLDTENIAGFAGPGCFKCEQAFTNRVAKQPCRGSISESP